MPHTTRQKDEKKSKQRIRRLSPAKPLSEQNKSISTSQTVNTKISGTPTKFPRSILTNKESVPKSFTDPIGEAVNIQRAKDINTAARNPAPAKKSFSDKVNSALEKIEKFTGEGTQFDAEDNVIGFKTGSVGIGGGLLKNLPKVASSARTLSKNAIKKLIKESNRKAKKRLIDESNRLAGLESNAYRVLFNSFDKMNPKIKNILPKVGNIPSNIDAKSTKDLVPINTKTFKTLKTGVEKWLANERIITTTSETGKISSKVVTSTGSLVSPRMLVGAGTALLLAAMGTGGAAMYLIWESIGGVGAATYAAYESGNTEAAREGIAATEELSNRGFWDYVKSFTPAFGIVDAFVDEGKKSVDTSIKIYNDILDDIEIKNETGTSDNEIWEARRQQKLDDETNKQLQILETSRLIIQMKEEAQDRKDEKAVAYWNDQLDRRGEYEEEQRRLNQEYWDRYRRLSSELRDAALPSNLKFGLL